jgi:O-antigen ligase
VDRRVLQPLRSTGGSWQPIFRSLIWLALLLCVASGAWGVVSAHQRRVRGIPEGFPAPVSNANVPILGVNVALEEYEDQELTSALTRIADGGFVWVRQSFTWSEIEPAEGTFDWSTPDRIVEALRRFPGLRLVAVLGDDPPSPPADAARFAAFAAAFAERYGDQVEAYQIWDEPNLAANWGGGPVSPPAYADLLAHVAPAIRATDPGAPIVLAGLAPTSETGPQNLSETRYLERLYEAGGADTFDVVAAKPYGFDTGPYDRRVDESILNLSRILLLREVMVQNGDADKAIWASHWGWNALPEGWDGAPSIWGQTDEATQASWTVAALSRARSEWPWAGAMIIENLQATGPAAGSLATTRGAEIEDPRWGFSLLDADGSPRPVYDAVTAWADTLPDAAPVGGYPVDNPLAAYEGRWRIGPLGADPGGAPSGADPSSSRASFRFEGTRVALTVRRGPYRGFVTVTVDGEPANGLPRDEQGQAYVVLYDKEPNVVTVPLATGLELGVHTVEIAVEGGEGEWPLVDWRVGAAPVEDGLPWALSGLGIAALGLTALLVLEVRRTDWMFLATGFLNWPEWGQAALTAGVSGLFWGAASLTWGRALSYVAFPVICLLVSVLALPVIVFLFALRPDLGLALVAFSAPFYLVPDAMFYRALSFPEILVILCSVACAVSRIVRPRFLRSKIAPRGFVNPLGDRFPWPGSGDRAGVRLAETDGAVALLVLSAVLAGAVADDRVAAAFELRTVFLLPALYYGLLRMTRPDGRTEWRMVDGFVLGGLGVALVGLAQFVLGRNLVIAEGGLPRVQSVYHSPNNVGLYLERVWPLLASVSFLGKGRRRKLYGAALVPVTLALVFSFSRGALLLGLPAAVLAMGWLAGGRFRRLTVVFLLVGAVALVPLLRLPRFAALLDLDRGTTFFRLKLWRSSLQMIRDHPLFGVGPGNFLDAYRTRYVLPTAWEEFNLEHPHNILLDHWARLGLLGLLAGAGIQIAFWRTTGQRDRRDPLTLGLTGGMAALLAHGLVDNTVFFADLALVLFLTLALAAGHRDGGDRPTDDDRGSATRTDSEIRLEQIEDLL